MEFKHEFYDDCLTYFASCAINTSPNLNRSIMNAFGFEQNLALMKRKVSSIRQLVVD